MRTNEQKYPALCEPELQTVIADWPPEKRRWNADLFERWVAQMRFSADLIDRYEGKGETLAEDDGDAQLLELAARLDQQAADIRTRLGLSAKPKAGEVRMSFTAEN